MRLARKSCEFNGPWIHVYVGYTWVCVLYMSTDFKESEKKPYVRDIELKNIGKNYCEINARRCKKSMIYKIFLMIWILTLWIYCVRAKRNGRKRDVLFFTHRCTLTIGHSCYRHLYAYKKVKKNQFLSYNFKPYLSWTGITLLPIELL